jgi:hypothetical protein
MAEGDITISEEVLKSHDVAIENAVDLYRIQSILAGDFNILFFSVSYATAVFVIYFLGGLFNPELVKGVKAYNDSKTRP